MSTVPFDADELCFGGNSITQLLLAEHNAFGRYSSSGVNEMHFHCCEVCISPCT